MTSLEPRAWITGASSGIGRAVAKGLADGGWRVSVSARRSDELEVLAAERPAGHIMSEPLDVTRINDVENTVAKLEATGPVDLAILAAGNYEPMLAENFQAATVEKLFEVNVLGVANALQAVIPRMLARRRGRIVIVASVAGYRGLPMAAAYGASKAALINMAESLRLELEAKGVVVQVCTPGFVRTPLTEQNPFPMPFLMTPEAAANRLIRGLQSRAFEITFPRRFTWWLKIARILPYAIYFPIVRRITKPRP